MDSALRIAHRQHFKVAYERQTQDLLLNAEPGTTVGHALIKEYGEDKVKLDYYIPRGQDCEFPVLQSDRRITSSLAMSEILRNLPTVAIDFVFVDPTIRDEAQRYIHENRHEILTQSEGEASHADQS